MSEKQTVYCRNCGSEMQTTFSMPSRYGGEVCSDECWEELKLKQAKAISGTLHSEETT